MEDIKGLIEALSCDVVEYEKIVNGIIEQVKGV